MLFWTSIILGTLVQLIHLLPKTIKDKAISKYPRLKIVSVIVSLILIIGGAIGLTIDYLDKKKYSVYISPENLKVEKGKAKLFYFGITNNNDFIVYDILVYITKKSGDIKLEDIKFKKIKEDMFPAPEFIFSITGRNKDSGEESLTFFISRALNSHSTRNFELFIDCIDCKMDSTFSLRVESWSDTPVSTTYERGKEYYYLEGIKAREQKQFKDAINMFNKAIEKDHNYIDAYIERGTTYVKIKEHDNALSDYSLAIKLDNKNVRAYYNRGWTYSLIGDYQNSIIDLEETLKIDPNYKMAYLALGFIYEYKKDAVNSLKNYKAYLSLANKNDKYYGHSKERIDYLTKLLEQ